MCKIWVIILILSLSFDLISQDQLQKGHIYYNTFESIKKEKIDYQKTDTLKGLVAVFIIGLSSKELGFYDKNLINNEDAFNEVKSIQRLVWFLMNHGVIVYQLYDNDITLSKVQKYLPLADIIVYNGHGNSWGDSIPNGFCLTSNNESIGYDELSKIKLPKKPLVIFSNVCTAAGSSADDLTYGDIGFETAFKRVRSHARLFTSMGASTYFAGNNAVFYKICLEQWIWNIPIKKIFIKENYHHRDYDPKTKKYSKETYTRIKDNKVVKEFLDNGNKVLITQRSFEYKKITYYDYNLAIYGNMELKISDPLQKI